MGVTSRAEQNLKKIHIVSELSAAYEQVEKARSEYRNARQEVIRTARTIGDYDPELPLATNEFSKQIKRVQVIDNEIKIFELDAPEVTGHYEKQRG